MSVLDRKSYFPGAKILLTFLCISVIKKYSKCEWWKHNCLRQENVRQQRRHCSHSVIPFLFCVSEVLTYSHHIGSLPQPTHNFFDTFRKKSPLKKNGAFSSTPQHPSSGCFLPWPCWLKISRVWTGALVQGRIGWPRHSEWGLVSGRGKIKTALGLLISSMSYPSLMLKIQCVKFGLTYYFYFA